MIIPEISPDTEAAGFRAEPGPHHSRTMMLAELSAILSSVPESASQQDIEHRVVEENVLMKPSESARRKTWTYLRSLYGLGGHEPLCEALRRLWDVAPVEQPMLACLCANARDALLRSTAPRVIGLPIGTPVVFQDLSEDIARSFPKRFSAASVRSIGQNALSSWTQAGHVGSGRRRVRQRAISGPVSTAYALLLGHLEGARSERLLRSFWTGLLDAPETTIEEHVRAAARQGLLEYRRAGEVVDISFSRLLGGGA